MFSINNRFSFNTETINAWQKKIGTGTSRYISFRYKTSITWDGNFALYIVEISNKHHVSLPKQRRFQVLKSNVELLRAPDIAHLFRNYSVCSVYIYLSIHLLVCLFIVFKLNFILWCHILLFYSVCLCMFVCLCVYYQTYNNKM